MPRPHRPARGRPTLWPSRRPAGQVATRVARADENVVREAIGAAVAAQPAMAALPAYERKAILMHVRRWGPHGVGDQGRLPESHVAGAAGRGCRRVRPRPRQLVKQFEERHEELSQALCIEAGKPIK